MARAVVGRKGVKRIVMILYVLVVCLLGIGVISACEQGEKEEKWYGKYYFDDSTYITLTEDYLINKDGDKYTYTVEDDRLITEGLTTNAKFYNDYNVLSFDLTDTFVLGRIPVTDGYFNGSINYTMGEVFQFESSGAFKYYNGYNSIASQEGTYMLKNGVLKLTSRNILSGASMGTSYYRIINGGYGWDYIWLKFPETYFANVQSNTNNGGNNYDDNYNDDASNDSDVSNEESKIYTYTFSTEGNGSLQGQTEQVVTQGETATKVKAIPNEGYKFKYWKYEAYGNGIDYYIDTPDLIVSTQDSKFNYLLENVFIAVFEKIVYTATYEGACLKYEYSANNGDQNASAYNPNGVTCAIFEISIDNDFSAPTITAVATEGYKFVKWSDGLTTATRKDNNLTEDIYVYAICERVYKVKFVSSVGGKINGQTEQEVLTGENASMVTAVANTGYRFVGWSYELGYTRWFENSSLTLTAMNIYDYFSYYTSRREMTITAEFEKI